MSIPQKSRAWVDMAVFENVNDGETLAAFFQSQGLESRTYDDKLFRYFLFLRPPSVTHRVQVRHQQLTTAGEHLKNNAPAILEKALHCPSCGSLQVNYPQMTRKFVLPTVLLHLGIIFHAFDHECYCEQCHCVWNLPKDGIVHKFRVARHFPF